MKKKSSSRVVKRVANKNKITQLRLFALLGLIGLLLAVFSYTAVTVQRELPCANSVSCTEDLSGTYESNATTGEFEGNTISVPQKTFATNTFQSVLGDSTVEKKIFVDLSSQHLYAKEGDTMVYDFPISSGKQWWPTPTGTFHIWIKLDATRMVGGSREKGDYYNLPNVRYTMFFYNDQVPKYKGYGIHGAYWHNNFGNPMSHGCINMKNEDVEKIYYWASPARTGYSTKATDDDPGTEIIIYGETPKAS